MEVTLEILARQKTDPDITVLSSADDDAIVMGTLGGAGGCWRLRGHRLAANCEPSRLNRPAAHDCLFDRDQFPPHSEV